MDTNAKQAIALDRMAEAFERYGVNRTVVKATRVLAGRKATEAILGTVK